MSDPRLPWFRCFPSALLGALAGLGPDEGLVYMTALLRIYETGGPVAENARTLSRRTGLTERKVTTALASLVDAGKLVLGIDGRLDSASTHAEIEWQRSRHDEQSRAGRASAAKRQTQQSAEKNDASAKTPAKVEVEKYKQNQRTEPTTVERPFNHLEEERDISPSDPKGSSAPKGARTRGCRLPEAFAESDEAWEVAQGLGFEPDEHREAVAEFCDYWRAVPGSKGTKLDWPATYRNRLREIGRRRPGHGSRAARAGPVNGQGQFSRSGVHDMVAQDLAAELGYLDGTGDDDWRLDRLAGSDDRVVDGPGADREVPEAPRGGAGEPGRGRHVSPAPHVHRLALAPRR